ncbi:MAG: hypothetical protein HFJ59_01585 [Clostridia bacterium]|nr:hypothetical protein [Clostridia bacterium]
MKTTIEGENSVQVTNLFSETVKSNIFKLIKLKKQNMDINKLRNIKKNMLQEDYEFLSKVYGEPSRKFDYTYIDNNGNTIELKDMTPLKFTEKHLSMNIEDFVFISNVPMFGRSYGEKIKNNNSNLVENSTVEFLHISSNELKELAIKQLKDNIPVIIGLTIKKFSNFKNGILDTRLYDYEKLVKYKKLTKEEGLTIEDIILHHYMTITGVYIEDEKPKRWKVEDSYGSEARINGYWIMNDNYFTDYVFTCIIDKKYLSEKQLELYNKKAIMENK